MRSEILRDEIKNSGFKLRKLMDEVGIANYTTFNNKLTGKSDFTLGEIRKLCELLNFTPEKVRCIFFEDGVD